MTRERLGELRLVLWIGLFSALAGSLYGQMGRGSLRFGAEIGFINGAVLSSLEVFVLGVWGGPWLQRLPFSVYLGIRIALYVGVAALLNATVLPLLTGTSALGQLDRGDLLFALCGCVVGNLIFGVDALLGPGVMFAFAAGRYHRPRREERALLYIDLAGSTSIAERLGEERFLDLLNAFYADISLGVAAEGGEVHKYVGDELIAVWRLRAGRAEPGPVRACFAALDRLAARNGEYERIFGQPVAFRAGLHAGTVVLGELGALKKEIALIGDAMNTTARILEACRETGASVLASAAMVAWCGDLPGGVKARRLPPIPLRGKAQPLELVALERAG